MLIEKIINLKKDINIESTLFSGQSFLWDNYDYCRGYFFTVINGYVLIIKQLMSDSIEIYYDSESGYAYDITVFINQYLSLDIDSSMVFHDEFNCHYSDIWMLLREYLTLRVIRQDPYETMISFMCAQGVGMHLIRKQITMLRNTYGEKMPITFFAKEIMLHKFPTPESLAAADPLKLSICTNNNKERAKNIVLVARAVVEGRIDLVALRDPKIPLEVLRTTLCQNRGIGFKIADCIALFGLGRFDAFPIDTHVKQYMGRWFKCSTALRNLTPATYLLLDAEARTFLNPKLAGYGGHMLFHCWRKEIKKLHSF